MLFKKFIGRCYKNIKLVKFQSKWRNLNRHNYTEAKNIFPINCVSVGKYTYGNLFIKTYNRPDEKLIIGNFCSIAEGTRFVLGGGHDHQNISSYPFKYYILSRKENEAITKGSIIIEDDVWIGYGCLILSGVTIGQGAVIGAGSVVAKNVPPYAVYAGYEIKKYRFDTNIIERMTKFDWSTVGRHEILKNMDSIYSLPDEDLFNSDFYKDHLKQREGCGIHSRT